MVSWRSSCEYGRAEWSLDLECLARCRWWCRWLGSGLGAGVVLKERIAWLKERMIKEKRGEESTRLCSSASDSESSCKERARSVSSNIAECPAVTYHSLRVGPLVALLATYYLVSRVFSNWRGPPQNKSQRLSSTRLHKWNWFCEMKHLSTAWTTETEHWNLIQRPEDSRFPFRTFLIQTMHSLTYMSLCLKLFERKLSQFWIFFSCKVPTDAVLADFTQVQPILNTFWCTGSTTFSPPLSFHSTPCSSLPPTNLYLLNKCLLLEVKSALASALSSRQLISCNITCTANTRILHAVLFLSSYSSLSK